MNNTKENGIHLQAIVPFDEVTTIDWDVVLCHFMWARALAELEGEWADTPLCEMERDLRDQSR